MCCSLRQGRDALNYNEDVLGGRGVDRLELLPRRRRVNVDPSKLEGLREAARERAGEAKGPQDSGLGVRIQVRPEWGWDGRPAGWLARAP